MVNRGEEKVRVHMNVVPRSAINTNGSLRASSPFGSHAIFILGEIYLGLARDLGASRERIGAGARFA